ncbi:MAG: alpha/beta hydrolase [Ectothiorhodospiraceae bacterium]|nr:alpha/beta hydrolase [Ectothiorhodospiraceae bacterium]
MECDLRSGPGDAPTVVLVHGWTCRRTYWNPQLEHLSGRFPVLALDLPGHGDSPVPDAPRTVESCAEDVISAVRKSVEGPVVLIGHSMGGAVALEAARALPDSQVQGVILADTFVIDYGGLDQETQQAIAAPFGSDFPGAIADLVENTSTDATPDSLKEKLKREMGEADTGSALPLWNSLLAWSPDKAFREIRAPIHAINGSLIPDSARKRCAPYVREWIQDGAGHFLQMEDPQRFNALLDQSLAALKHSRDRIGN